MNISHTLRCSGLKSCSAHKVPLLKKAYVQAHLKFANKHQGDSEEDWEKMLWSDDTKIEFFWHQLDSLSLEGKKADMVVEMCFGAVSQLREQDDYTELRERWMGPSTGKSWVKTSLLQLGHWRWVIDGCSSMTMT